MAIITHPHGPLTQLADNLWYVSAKTSQGIDRKMVVIRGEGNALFLYDALWLDDATFAQLEALGDVSTIFVPSWLHDFDGQRFAFRYPNAKLCGLPTTLKRLKRWRRLEPFLAQHAPACVKISELPGLRWQESVCEVRHGDATASLLLCDALANMSHGKGLRGWIQMKLGNTGPLRMTPMARLLVTNKTAYRSWLEEQSRRKDLKNVIVGHGRVITDNAPALLAAAAARLGAGAQGRVAGAAAG